MIEWALLSRGKYPALENLYHVPNEGKRSPAAGGIAKSLGLRPGVPDLILDYPAGIYHGLRIEMKVGKNTPTEAQKDWLCRLQSAGYLVAVCWSAQAAIRLLKMYMELKPGEEVYFHTDLLLPYGFPAIRE